MRIYRPLRSAKTPLAVCLTLSGLALAGCSAAPASATNAPSPASSASPAPVAGTGPVSAGPVTGPVSTGPVSTLPASTGTPAPNFEPFPIPPTWSGGGGSGYTMSFKTVGGTTPREFSIFVTSSLVFWLGCIGTGTASIASPSINLNWGVPCAPGTGASPTGITFIPPHATDGTVVEVQVAAPPGDRWEFRVDVPQPAQ